MHCCLDMKGILDLVNRQLHNYWDISLSKENYNSLEIALLRLEKSYARVKSKYFENESGVVFKIEHTVQYAIFLYLFSNQLYRDGHEKEAGFVYYLNKIMHSVDWFYAIELPEHFCAEHPLGCVLGRASYGDYFFVYQGVTVGGAFNQIGEICYPKLGNYVIMYSDSKVIGDSKIGNNVVIAANAYIQNTDIPDNSLVFGQSPNLVIKTGYNERIKGLVEHTWKV